MVSPGKVQKADENTMEGFLFSVSPRRQSKNGNPFFRAVIQSARQEYNRVGIFFMEKQALFMQAAKSGKAVRLRNVKRSLSKICCLIAYVVPFIVLTRRLFRSGWLRNLVLPFYQPESDEPAVSPLCAAELQEAHYSGGESPLSETAFKLNGSVNKVVPVNCSDFELKEVVTYEGTGDMKVTLWDPFVKATKATKSYAFKNLCTRDRGGCIYLSTSPSSIIEPITDLTVAEDKSETSQQESSLCCNGARAEAVVAGLRHLLLGKGHNRDGQRQRHRGPHQLGAVHIFAEDRPWQSVERRRGHRRSPSGVTRPRPDHQNRWVPFVYATSC
ncbi:hypothetical protein E1301_Tti021513 [Triplophysa tibetana]|uniref:Uncharacterized protein n=1 Tax=Triplophysa tibetana TaxID=1572043 RepID=A0A5A9N0G8_9TELE|nr:hypothetical protein E1301_Tti021513 [Triplophysa tibetana]